MNDIQFDEHLFKKLTPREIEIVKAAAEGWTCQMTADNFGTTLKTVQVQRSKLIKKLRCGHIAGAVALLIRSKIIS